MAKVRKVGSCKNPRLWFPTRWVV